MSLVVSKNEGFKPVDAGTYMARCIKVVDVGTQHGEYQGKPTTKRQVIITWELPTELIQDGDYKGQPFGVSKFYTASLGDKANLRKDLESWRGKAFTQEELNGFDLKNILGKPCMLSVIHNDKGRAVVSSVSSPMKGMQVPPAINPLIFFSIDEWNEEIFCNLSEGVQKIIKQSDEYKQMHGLPDYSEHEEEESVAPKEDEIPF